MPPEARRSRVAWSTLLWLSCFYAFYYSGRINWGVLAPWLVRDRHFTASQIGLVATLMFGVYSLTAFLHGPLSDRFGWRLWAALGGFGTTLANWVTSLGATLPAMAIPYAANGAFQSMAYGPGNGLLAQWWPRSKRGFAQGFFLTAADLSGIVAWLLTGVTAAWFGLSWALRLPFIPTVGASILLLLMVRDRPRQRGLPELPRDPRDPDTAVRIRDLLRNPRFLAALAVGFVGYIGRYGLYTWIPLYWAETSGLQLGMIPLTTLVLPLGMLLGPVAAGMVSDRWFGGSRWPVISFSMLLSAVALAAMAIWPIRLIGILPSLALLLVSGFFVMGGLGLVYSIGVDLTGPMRAGTGAGLVDGTNYAGAALQGVVIGTILTASHHDWSITFLLIAAVMGLGGATMLVLRDPVPRERAVSVIPR